VSPSSQAHCVVDAVTVGERREDERGELVPGVRPAGSLAQIEVTLHELAKDKVVARVARSRSPVSATRW
jgi:hypothetical protein